LLVAFCRNNPFRFDSEEQARIISGEEEAIYGWTAINYLMGTLLENDIGFGAVEQPNRTFGALDMGGASTQISFYEPSEDVVANLFKMQVASKHWNVYAHSFLYFGANLSRERLSARIVFDTDTSHSVAVTGTAPALYVNPCLAHDSLPIPFTSKIRFREDGIESWLGMSATGKDMPPYSVTLSPDADGDNFNKCHNLAVTLLRKESNAWCDFAHGGDCSYAGIYQPHLPRQSPHFGDFFAFANYLHIWKFLRLDIRSSVLELKEAAEKVCSLSWKELNDYNNGRTGHLDDLPNYCFLATYAYTMLTTGYGFHLEDHITTASVINGQKVGWPLGSTLYEINAMRWKYTGDVKTEVMGTGLMLMIVFLIATCCVLSWKLFQLQNKRGYSVWSLVPERHDDEEEEEEQARERAEDSRGGSGRNYGAIA
jgi:hypothetical protein